MLQLGSMAFCAAAWKSLAQDTSFLTCLTARFIRNGVSNLAGVIPAIGEVAGARALSLLGGPVERWVHRKGPDDDGPTDGGNGGGTAP